MIAVKDLLEPQKALVRLMETLERTFPHKVKELATWADVKAFFQKDLPGQLSNWVFRGHSRHHYRLESSLDRTNTKHRKLVAEQYFIYQFKKSAHHHLPSSAVPTTTLEWLALMQHHGAPTRLLDFTRSPYVACFFALESFIKQPDCQEENWRAVWCIDADWLRKAAIYRISRRIYGFQNIQSTRWQDPEFLSTNFEDIFLKRSVDIIVPLEPPRSNERLLIQQGVFLCPGAVDKGFERTLADCAIQQAPDEPVPTDMAEHIYKLKISEDCRRDALYDLHLMNVNWASLFYGLDGFAKSLEHKLEIEYERDHLHRMLKQLSF
jgi:hypothetical protein